MMIAKGNEHIQKPSKMGVGIKGKHFKVFQIAMTLRAKMVMVP
jgi:hypothetical protein